jgi:hypothetical protein
MRCAFNRTTQVHGLKSGYGLNKQKGQGVTELPVTVTKVPIAEAVDNRGRDVRSVLAAEDREYFDQPTNHEWAELTFTEPEAMTELDRTIFAVTSGWYEIHLYSDGPPDNVNLQRLAFEPGYAVRKAMSEYRDFRRTGRLGYIKSTAIVP